MTPRGYSSHVTAPQGPARRSQGEIAREKNLINTLKYPGTVQGLEGNIELTEIVRECGLADCVNNPACQAECAEEMDSWTMETSAEMDKLWVAAQGKSGPSIGDLVNLASALATIAGLFMKK
jgi:hypothetical protein